jgi:uncharacterized protein YciI
MPETLHVLFYDYVADVAERRGPLRPAHLELVRAYHGDGRIVMAGAYGDPLVGGLLVFRSPEAAQAFAGEDPYVSGGLVERWRVHPWTVVT